MKHFRTMLAVLASLVVVYTMFPTPASAQTGTAQIVVVTKTEVNSATPTTSNLVTVVASGPSLSSAPSTAGSLSFSAGFGGDTRVITVIPGSFSVTAQGSGSYLINQSGECSGYINAGAVKTCTFTAVQAGVARLNISMQVVNQSGYTYRPEDFFIAISGQNPSVTSMRGSSSPVQVTLGAGTYAVNVSDTSYFVERSAGCAGFITFGESRSCVITLRNQTAVGSAYTSYPLTCSASRASLRIGEVGTFSAAGGSGSYTWVTADRTFPNVGSVLNTYFSNAGVQSVYVTSGYETATCTINVSNTAVTPGSVLGVSTSAPGFPNTGFGPLFPTAESFTIGLPVLIGLVAISFPFVLFFLHARTKRNY